MGVTKHDPQLQEESALVSTKHRSATMRVLMKSSAFRKLYFILNSNDKGNWPTWIQKTDEERIQVCAKILVEHYKESWYITEKLDGQSGTFFTYSNKVWGFKRKSFGVCSRNIWLKTKTNCNYWKVAISEDLEKKLKSIDGNVVIQGEICGPGIQKNKYERVDPVLYVFNVFIDGKMLSQHDMSIFCYNHKLNMVPILNSCFFPLYYIPIPEEHRTVASVVEHLVKLAEGTSKIYNCKREGIVIRLNSDPRVSFKVINPFFLIDNKE
jgi:RNA ligase (TIGR02306 family)